MNFIEILKRILRDVTWEDRMWNDEDHAVMVSFPSLLNLPLLTQTRLKRRFFSVDSGRGER